ncbi:MAG: tetratricopeptide repeat protein [Ardenticatenaceae bacterium]|nr:tetratricopeptide repeat protein [Ardenticatenaceae bacterium]
MSDQDIQQEQALILFERAYKAQMKGEFGDALFLYKRSVETFPTAEAYTFWGWTYAMMNRFDEAIEMCHQAIATDPDFGNPYNDIGSYLIEMEQWQEAIPWLEKALAAPRYEARHYPHINLGRVYAHLGDFQKALAAYDEALALEPLYMPATNARRVLLGQLN